MVKDMQLNAGLEKTDFSSQRSMISILFPVIKITKKPPATKLFRMFLRMEMPILSAVTSSGFTKRITYHL